MSTFNIKALPLGTDKVAIVTGANTGLGYETSLQLAERGYSVIMACRNKGKAMAAMGKIMGKYPEAKLKFLPLDLNRLEAVREFAKQFLDKYERLDLLINNAGIMMPPYELTPDGFESQMGVNYLSHFLLTGLLLECMEKTPNARVVTLSSLAHRWGDIFFDDLDFSRGYDPKKAYGQSKLACLMFSYELQRRLDSHGYHVASLAAHPGISATELGRHMPKVGQMLAKIIGPLFMQAADKGALPTLRAALDPYAHGGEYYGPNGYREYKGDPVKVDSDENSKDLVKANRLWELSEELTGLDYLS